MILEPKKIKSATVSTVSPSVCREVMGKWLWVETLKNTQVYYESGMNIVLHAIISVIAVFCICTVIDQLRIQLLEKYFIKVWDRIEEKVNLKKQYRQTQKNN